MIALAARGISIEETKNWTAAMRLAAIEILRDADKKAEEKAKG